MAMTPAEMRRAQRQLQAEAAAAAAARQDLPPGQELAEPEEFEKASKLKTTVESKVEGTLGCGNGLSCDACGACTPEAIAAVKETLKQFASGEISLTEMQGKINPDFLNDAPPKLKNALQKAMQGDMSELNTISEELDVFKKQAEQKLQEAANTQQGQEEKPSEGTKPETKAGDTSDANSDATGLKTETETAGTNPVTTTPVELKTAEAPVVAPAKDTQPAVDTEKKLEASPPPVELRATESTPTIQPANETTTTVPVSDPQVEKITDKGTPPERISAFVEDKTTTETPKNAMAEVAQPALETVKTPIPALDTQKTGQPADLTAQGKNAVEQPSPVKVDQQVQKTIIRDINEIGSAKAALEAQSKLAATQRALNLQEKTVTTVKPTIVVPVRPTTTVTMRESLSARISEDAIRQLLNSRRLQANAQRGDAAKEALRVTQRRDGAAVNMDAIRKLRENTITQRIPLRDNMVLSVEAQARLQAALQIANLRNTERQLTRVLNKMDPDADLLRRRLQQVKGEGAPVEDLNRKNAPKQTATELRLEKRPPVEPIQLERLAKVVQNVDPQKLRDLQRLLTERTEIRKVQANHEPIKKITDLIKVEPKLEVIRQKMPELIKELAKNIAERPSETLKNIQDMAEAARLNRRATNSVLKEIAVIKNQYQMLRELKLLNQQQANTAAQLIREINSQRQSLKLTEQSIVRYRQTLEHLIKMRNSLAFSDPAMDRMIAQETLRLAEAMMKAQQLRDNIEGLNEEWASFLKDLDIERLLAAGIEVSESDQAKKRSGKRKVKSTRAPDLEGRHDLKRNAKANAKSGPMEGATSASKSSAKTSQKVTADGATPTAQLITVLGKTGDHRPPGDDEEELAEASE